MFMSSKSAIALSSLLLLVGFQDGRSDPRMPRPRPTVPAVAPPAAGAPNPHRPARLQISVFEVDVGEPGKFIESIERLRSIASEPEFEKALDEFGTPHRFSTIDRMADLSEEVSLVLGSTLPIVQGKAGTPNKAVTVQYQDVCSKLNIRPGIFESGENCLYASVELELSTVANSRTELGDGVFPSIYTKCSSKSVMRLEFGKSDVTIDFVSHSKDEKARAIIIRSVVTPLNEAK